MAVQPSTHAADPYQRTAGALTHVEPTWSKIARWAPNDREDVAELVRLGLTTADEIDARARAALGGYVGGQSMLLVNLRDAVALAREVEPARGV